MRIVSKNIFLTFSLLGLLFFFQNNSYAQDIFYSKEEKFDILKNNFSIIGRSDYFIFTYTATGNGYFLNAYNDSMTLKAKIALDFFPSKTLHADFIIYPKNMLVLYQAEERNRLIQYAALLDEKAMLIGKPMAIDSVKASWLGESKAYFRFAKSPDKQKVMIYGVTKKDIKVTLLDHQIKKQFSRKYALNNSGKAVISQVLLDNNGQFYFSVRSDKTGRNLNAEFQWYFISPQTKRLEKKVLPKHDFYFGKLLSKINFSDSKIYTAGFYSDKRNGNILGLAHFYFDPSTKEFSEIKHNVFSNEFRNHSKVKNKNRAFNESVVKEIVLKNDGGFLLISEDESIFTRTDVTPGWGYYGGYANRSVKEFNYGDILFQNIDGSGLLSWYEFVRKNQYTRDDEGLFSSFAFLNSGASIVTLFNDFQENSDKLIIAVMGNGGKVQTQSISPGNIGSSIWLPRKAVQISKTTWLVPVINRNNLFFARVDFN